MRVLKVLAAGYALVVYAFIFLPVAVLVLFSFQGSLFPVPPFTGPSLRWYDAVLGDRRLTAGLVNSVAVAVLSSLLPAPLQYRRDAFPGRRRAMRARPGAQGRKHGVCVLDPGSRPTASPAIACPALRLCAR